MHIDRRRHADIQVTRTPNKTSPRHSTQLVRYFKSQTGTSPPPPPTHTHTLLTRVVLSQNVLQHPRVAAGVRALPGGGTGYAGGPQRDVGLASVGGLGHELYVEKKGGWGEWKGREVIVVGTHTTHLTVQDGPVVRGLALQAGSEEQVFRRVVHAARGLGSVLAHDNAKRAVLLLGCWVLDWWVNH